MNSSVGDFAATPDNHFRLLAWGQLALLVATWPLWIPQTVFPQVPLISIVGQLPRSFDWGLLVLLLAALTIMLLVKKPVFRRSASLLTALCTLWLVCVDQHRLQPWAWQFILVSLVLATAEDRTALAAWRWLVIGIYGWSAWSKMDYGFCVHHGPFLLDGFFQSIGLINGTRFWNDNVRFFAAAAIPIMELFIALGLIWQRSRRYAVIGAAMMHVGLLFALGPFGHQHQPGVLIWNVFFLVQNWILFRDQRIPSPLTHDQSPPLGTTGTLTTGSKTVLGPLQRNKAGFIGDTFAAIVILAAMMWPLLEPLGLCDHWPAWAVYAARPERVTVFLDRSDLAKLPENMKRHLGTVEFGDWFPLRIDRWSLESVHAPLYPQDRFQVGVTLGLVRDLKLNQIRVDIEGPANWWTGKRIVRQYVGLESVDKLANTHRCGAQPR